MIGKWKLFRSGGYDPDNPPYDSSQLTCKEVLETATALEDSGRAGREVIEFLACTYLSPKEAFWLLWSILKYRVTGRF